MRDRLYKKVIVYGLFLLLIGFSFTVNISGNIGKTNIQKNREIPTNIPIFDNDYINAFWNFEEGNGNIANDNSGHEYDGTIYGASWTTDAIEGSSYALDFDGTNDYISFDAHSHDLGFNKTDDLIFSFHFKSNTNNKGMFYSLSHKWGTNPETHIYLDDDGTVGFQIKVTSCGFEFNTNNDYNDGEWHYVEIWYSGITNEPTVTIFVDDQEEAVITYWVCPFNSDEFGRVKIGRRSHEESYYFDGKIDDFKIIKYPGGNEQNPPEVDGPTSGDTGTELFFTFTTEDPEGDDIWLWIEWGDDDIEEWIGPYDSGEVVTVSHTWDEMGAYVIKAKSKDIWDQSQSTCFPVIIGNQPPNSPEITGPKCGDPGIEYDYTFKSDDSEGDNISYYIDWGDGENTGWLGPYTSGEEFTLSHIWSLEGEYELKVKAKDDIAGESQWSSKIIRIGNTAPNKPTISGPLTGVPNVELDYIFKAIDPDGDDLYYYINWGDGAEITNFGPISSGEEIMLSHTWTEIGEFEIKAKVKDPCDEESFYEVLKITIPRNKATYNILFLRLLERFPLLERLINLTK